MIAFVAVVAVLLTHSHSACSLSVQSSHFFHGYQLRSTAASSSLVCRYANGAYDDDRPRDAIKSRRVPRRALPHIQISSRAEEASRAGYIIRRDHYKRDEAKGRGRAPDRDPALGGNRRVRPLRIIRRIVLRSRGRNQQDNATHGAQTVEGNSLNELMFPNDELAEVTIEVRYGPNVKPKLTHSAEPPTRLIDPKFPSARSSDQSTANRVTFKASRKSSRTMPSYCSTASAITTLTDYMMQPVEQYSLLSFHDHEPLMKNTLLSTNESSVNKTSLKARRWLVRRLTSKEAERYVNSSAGDRPKSSPPPSSVDNLFRLAVPLQPLIGWDLTPVIDLEVIPPQVPSNINECESLRRRNEKGIRHRYKNSESDIGLACNSDLSKKPSKWDPLKRIRKRVVSGSDFCESDNGLLPVVKIRSLSVSLLSTQEDVRAVMLEKDSSTNKSLRNNHTSKMQEEAIGMVGKVEEWLKPHITFEAELSWSDDQAGHVMANDVNHRSPMSHSTVTVKSTAITSLTIPSLPPGILHATVPSAFLVKRLGSTLTSKALEICLPRFLRQLEQDYYRWSGLDDTSATNDCR